MWQLTPPPTRQWQPPDVPWDGRVQAGLQSPLGGVLGSEVGWAYCPQEPTAQAPSFSLRHKPQPDGSLVISPLRAEDAGIYSCGSSRPGRDSQKIQLHVTGLQPPSCPRGFSWAPSGRPWLGGPEPGGSYTGGALPAGRDLCSSRAEVEVLPLVVLIFHGSLASVMAPPSFHHILLTAHPFSWPHDRG